MPLHKHEPIDEAQMLVDSPNHSICEVLRQIYHKSTDPDVRLNARVATTMAKAMTAKLSTYNKQWYSDFWDPNPNYNFKLQTLMMSQHDWANTGWRFFKLLQLIGVKGIIVKGELHPFDYPKQAPIHPALANKGSAMLIRAPGLKPLADEAEILHFYASTYVNTGVDPHSKPVIMQHGGSAYRKHHEKLNAIYNEFVDSTIIQCPDLLGLGAVNEVLIYYPVDTQLIKPRYDRLLDDRLVIGHFPSNPLVKGTENILKVIEKLKADKALSSRFKYVGTDNASKMTHIVPWEHNIDRIAKCDILIETCSPDLDGRVYGEWANAALEAAASGCIVVTNTLTPELYAKEYGDCALHIANDPEALEKKLRDLISLSDDEIQKEKEAARKWAVDKHGMIATAKRLWDKVYCHYIKGKPDESNRDNSVNQEGSQGAQHSQAV